MKKQLLLLVCILVGQFGFALDTSLPPTAVISYNTPICNDNPNEQAVVITGTGNYTGGIYAATPIGLSISPNTGTINPLLSVAGIYQVTYTIPAGVDPELQVMTTVQILPAPHAGNDGNTTVCSTSTGVIDLFSLILGEQAGGTWTRTAGTGGTFNAIAGVFTPAFGATTSTFTYTVNGIFPCVNDVSTATVTINQQPIAGYGGAVSVCNTDATPISLSDILYGEQPGGTWARTSGTGGSLNVATGVFTPAPGSTTSSDFVYTVTGPPPCSTNTAMVTLNFGTEITIIDTFPDVTECMSYVLPTLQNGNYYTGPGGTGQMLQPGTEIPWSQTIYVYVQSGNCSGEVSFNVTITPMSIPIFDPIPPICAGSIAPNLPTVSSNGIVGTWTPATVNTWLPATYTFMPDFGTDFCSEIYTFTTTIVNCFGISLNAFLDLDADGIKDNGEPDFPLGQFHFERNNDGVIHNVLSPTGNCEIGNYNLTDTFDVSFSIASPDDVRYQVTTEAYYNISASEIPQTYNFPVTVVQVYSALSVTFSPSGFPRAGNNWRNWISYTNQGNTAIASGTINFTHDPILTLDANNSPEVIPTSNGCTYNFTDLAPFETRHLRVELIVPAIPTVSLGQFIMNSVIASAGNLSDSASLSAPIVNSYDPNDKVENHGGKIVFADFTADDYLYYTIRFENTGNADAFDVRINDVLDAQLDESTVKLVSGSHPYVLERMGSELNFVFADINLPPSVADTEIGKGYVSFKVKPKAGYAVGDIIPNAASIYFDTNPAIDTNTFNTEFVTNLAKTDFDNSSFVLYPNPANTAFRIQSNKNTPVDLIRIFDLLGKLVLSEAPKSEGSIGVQSLDAGIYFVEVTSAGKKYIQKLIVK